MKIFIDCDAKRNDAITAIVKLIIDKKNKWCFEIKKYRKKRSLDQNSLYWMWMSILEKESGTGYIKEEFHEYFLRYFGIFSKEMFESNLYKRTSEMTTIEMYEYMEKIRHFCLTNEFFHIILPLPDDDKLFEFYDKYI
jgi:hypothetical protein